MLEPRRLRMRPNIIEAGTVTALLNAENDFS
jgi:hypothetical protein